MKLEKWAMRLVNLLLTAFFAFAILAFLEQFSRTGWAWYSRSLRCWPLLLAFPIGLLSRALGRWKLPLLAVSVLLYGLIMALGWPAWSFLEVLYLICALIVAAAAYFLGLRGEEPSRPGWPWPLSWCIWGPASTSSWGTTSSGISSPCAGAAWGPNASASTASIPPASTPASTT